MLHLHYYGVHKLPRRVYFFKGYDIFRHEHGDEFPEGAPTERDKVLHLPGRHATLLFPKSLAVFVAGFTFFAVGQRALGASEQMSLSCYLICRWLFLLANKVHLRMGWMVCLFVFSCHCDVFNRLCKYSAYSHGIVHYRIFLLF